MVEAAKLKDHLSLAQLAHRWCVSLMTLRRLIKKGDLGVVRRSGAYFVKIEDAEILEQSRNLSKVVRKIDPLEVRAFQLFAEKKPHWEVCIALRLTPRAVDRLYDDFCNSDLEIRRTMRTTENYSAPLHTTRHKRTRNARDGRSAERQAERQAQRQAERDRVAKQRASSRQESST